MNETVYLRQNADSGAWLYKLSSSNRMTGSVTLANGDVKVITVGQRIPRDIDGAYLVDTATMEKQAKFQYHYVVLDDDYTGADKAELLADGWTETGTLNVETGLFELIEA